MSKKTVLEFIDLKIGMMYSVKGFDIVFEINEMLEDDRCVVSNKLVSIKKRKDVYHKIKDIEYIYPKIKVNKYNE